MKPGHISNVIYSEESPQVDEAKDAYASHFLLRAKERFGLDFTPADVERLNRVVRNRLGQKFDPWVVPLGRVSRQNTVGDWVKRIGLLLWIEDSYYVCVYDLKAESLVTILPSAAIRLAKDQAKGSLS